MKLIKVQSPASAVNGHVAAVEVEIAVDFHDVVGLRSRKAEVTAVYGKLINSKGSVITRLHIQCSGGLSRALSVDRKASVPLVPDRAAGVCGCGQRLPVNEDYAHVAVYAEGAVIGHVAADDVPSRGISARAEDGIAAPHKYLEILAELFFSVFVQVFIPVAYREVKRSSSAVRVYAVDRHCIYSGVLHGIGVYELVVISALYKLLSVSRLDGICGRYLLARVFIKPLARYGGIVRKIVDEILAAYELKLRKLNGVALPAAVELKAEIFICVGVSYGKSIRGRALRLQNGVVLNVCYQSPRSVPVVFRLQKPARRIAARILIRVVARGQNVSGGYECLFGVKLDIVRVIRVNDAPFRVQIAVNQLIVVLVATCACSAARRGKAGVYAVLNRCRPSR